MAHFLEGFVSGMVAMYLGKSLLDKTIEKIKSL